jgi:poly(3-hydroxybutyrate) depolymerase
VSIAPTGSVDPSAPATSDPGATASDGDGGASPEAATTPAPTPTPGCGTAKPTAGLQKRTITVGGAARQYKLFVPAAYDPTQPTRLAFMFHGLGGNGDQIRAYLSLEAASAGAALFVYPDGLPQTGAAGGRTAWAESDLAFVDAMLAEIEGAYCVDQKRVFAAGHSFGGYMTNLVGCERADVFRAIAPVSGGLVAGACKGPVAAWIAHGDADQTVPQSEGIAARDHWLGADTCATTSQPTTPSSCVRYDGCASGYPVEWCSFSGGHFPLPAFTQQAIWDFFKAL